MDYILFVKADVTLQPNAEEVMVSWEPLSAAPWHAAFRVTLPKWREAVVGMPRF